MEQGSIEELILTRSVTKHIRKNNKSFVSTQGVGVDYSQVPMSGDMVTAEACYEDPFIAWIKAFNNLFMSGAKAIGARITMLLPVTCEEIAIKGYMSTFNQLADSRKLQIMGGQTKVSSGICRPMFVVTAYGEAGKWCPNIKGIEEDFDIVMVGYTGHMGANLIAKNCFEKLCEHFSKDYIEGYIADEASYSLEEVSMLLADENTFYMHDVSTGGIHGALWQLGSRINKGLAIDHFKLPVKQETIEICEYYNLNPYMLEGTGAVAVVVKSGDETVSRLKACGFVAATIGKVTSNKEKVVFINDEKRFLAPPKGDEIYKVIEI